MIGVSVSGGICHRTASAAGHIADDMLAALKVHYGAGSSGATYLRRASGTGASRSLPDDLAKVP
jgi:hypothetical protein